MSAPRPWTALDNQFFSQPKIRKLKTRFGPAGIAVFIYALLEAGSQSQRDKSGVAHLGWPEVSLAIGVEDSEDVRAVIFAMAELGEVVIEAEDEAGGTIRFLGWSDWLPGSRSDPTNAERQRRWRASQKSPKSAALDRALGAD